MKIQQYKRGTKIADSGFYVGVPMSAYHGDLCVAPSVSSSGLRTIFSRSPKHFWKDSYLNPKRKPQDEKAHFVLGRAAHHLLLGEAAFSTEFIMRPESAPDGRDWNGNNKSCRAWIAEQAAAGRSVLTPNQIEQIRGMARSLADEPIIICGALNGLIEHSMVFLDKATGIYCKSRPDAIPNDSGDFVDLKSTASVDFELDRDIFETYRYDMQAAVAAMGWKELTGENIASFSFCFVESEDPHDVSFITLGQEDISDAMRDVRAALDAMAWCLEHDFWFGTQGTQRDARGAYRSEWAKKKAEVRRDFLAHEITRPEIEQPSGADYLAVP